jgi:hypothetical protein
MLKSKNFSFQKIDFYIGRPHCVPGAGDKRYRLANTANKSMAEASDGQSNIS